MSTIRTSVVRACAAALSGAALLLVPASPASAAVTPAPSDALCEAAHQHVLDAEPQRARDLVVAARRATGILDLCFEEAVEAGKAFSIAANAVARASLEAGLDDPDWEYVHRNAEAALAADAADAEAAALLEEAEEHLEQTGLDAREEEVGWTDFREDTVEPLARLLLAGAAIALGLLVLARLLTLAWPARLRLASRRSRVAAAAAGGAGLAASVGSPLWLPGASSAVVAATGAGLVLTVLLLALALASRLRVAVVVRRADGSADEAAAATVVAALRSAAADPPRGREVPEGTDARGLAHAVISAEGSGSRAATWLRKLVGLVPWRVAVHTGDETRVVVTRHGRSAGAVVVAPAPLGADGPAVDPVTMAAAFVVLVLSRAYRPDFEPVADVAEWQSLGWTLAAPGLDDPEHRRALLAAAVSRDPGNLLAQVALRHERDRHEHDQRTLEQYSRWLEDRADDLAARDRWRELQARLLLTATAVELNRTVVTHPPGRRSRTPAGGPDRVSAEPGGARADAQRLAVRLSRLLADRRLDAGLLTRLRPVASVLTLAAFGAAARTTPSVDDQQDLDVWGDHHSLDRDQQQALTLARAWHAHVESDPEARFVEACRLVEAARPGSDRRLVTRALELLAEEVQRPGGRTRMAHDPCLGPLVASGRFRKRYPAPPRTDLLELEPFVRHADELRRLALDTPSALWEATEDEETVVALASHLHVLPSTVRQLGEASALAADVPEHLGELRLEVYDALWGCGVRSPDDLRALSPRVLAEAVKQAGAERGLWYATEPDEDQGLLEWFASHGATSLHVPAQRGPGSARTSTHQG